MVTDNNLSSPWRLPHNKAVIPYDCNTTNTKALILCAAIHQIWQSCRTIEVVELMTLSPLAATEVVILTTSTASSDNKVINVTTLSFQTWYFHGAPSCKESSSVMFPVPEVNLVHLQMTLMRRSSVSPTSSWIPDTFLPPPVDPNPSGPPTPPWGAVDALCPPQEGRNMWQPDCHVLHSQWAESALWPLPGKLLPPILITTPWKKYQGSLSQRSFDLHITA